MCFSCWTMRTFFSFFFFFIFILVCLVVCVGFLFSQDPFFFWVCNLLLSNAHSFTRYTTNTTTKHPDLRARKLDLGRFNFAAHGRKKTNKQITNIII